MIVYKQPAEHNDWTAICNINPNVECKWAQTPACKAQEWQGE